MTDPHITSTEAAAVLRNPAAMQQWMAAVAAALGGGGGGFPLTLDDGTYTYELTAAAGVLTLKAFVNATPSTHFVQILYDLTGSPAGDLDIIAKNDMNWSAAHDFNISATRDTNVGATRNVTIDPSAGLAFWSAVPVAQPAHPTTLADVIAILTNYGLCA